MLRYGLIGLQFVLAAILVLAAIAKSRGEDFQPSEDAVVVYEQAMAARQRSGLPVQTHDPGLASIAQRVANYQARIGSMTHTSAGDNIVATGGDPHGMVRIWLGSPPHRAWLLGGATHCGYGFAVANGRTFAAGIFRSSGCDCVDPADTSGLSGSGGSRRGGRWFRRR